MLPHTHCGGGEVEYNRGMTGSLPLKADWWEEQCGEEVMELHVVNNVRTEREADGDYDIENLTDTQLDEKIDRLKRFAAGRKRSGLADGGQKLDIYLKKHIDEKNRRSRTHKFISEGRSPLKAERCLNSENIKNFNSHLSTPDYQRYTSFQSSWAARRQRQLKPDDNNTADIRANAFDDDLDYANRKCKQLMGNGQQNSHDRQIRNSRCSPRQSISSSFSSCPSNKGKLADMITRSNQLGSSQRSPIFEENGCSRSDGKRVADSTYTLQTSTRKCFSFTPESSMKKTIVVLDEDDEKPKRQYQARRISARWKKHIRIYYPERDHPESVEICLSDMECLAPFSYLSSAIMNFYIQYIQRSEFLYTECKNDYHFFNTFFYSKLEEASEEALDSQSKQEVGNSFAKLRRWFKGVNIFEKAYIFLPIHACQHWSLAIISIPAREYEAGPIILHLDSLGLHASQTIFVNIRSYLIAEWEYLNQSEVPVQVPIAEKIWKELPHKIQEKQIQVPQQQNDYDCGLFVLFFMERFIEEAPPRLRETDLDRFGRKWFQPAEASHLRDSIRILLEKHFKEAEKSIQDTMDDDSLLVVLEDLE